MAYTLSKVHKVEQKWRTAIIPSWVYDNDIANWEIVPEKSYLNHIINWL